MEAVKNVLMVSKHPGWNANFPHGMKLIQAVITERVTLPISVFAHCSPTERIGAHFKRCSCGQQPFAGNKECNAKGNTNRRAEGAV